MTTTDAIGYGILVTMVILAFATAAWDMHHHRPPQRHIPPPEPPAPRPPVD